MNSIIRKLGQAALPAQDLSRAIAFYRDILGIPYLWGNRSLAFFQLADVRLLLEIPEAPEFDHPGSVLYFDVEDIDVAVAELESRGLIFDDQPHRIGDLGSVSVWMAFFHDTEGNVLALQSERPVTP